jgi:PAS domain S-box-containing protein
MPHTDDTKLRSLSISGTDNLAQLGFENASLPSIILTVSDGRIIRANKAAAKLFRYSNKLLLTKNAARLFEITHRGFIKTLKQKKENKPAPLLVGLKKQAIPFPCELSHSFFTDGNGIKNVVISITDKTSSISAQLRTDVKNARIISDNIVLARSKQKAIDLKNKKRVAADIVIAKAKQKLIDTRNKRTVAKNIGLAKAKQHGIDTRNEKTVNHNISVAKAAARGEKLVYENIVRKKVIKEIEDNFRAIFNSSTEVLTDVNLVTGKIIFNNAYATEFGFKNPGDAAAPEDWWAHIHPDDKDTIVKDLQGKLGSKETEWKTGYRFLKADGTVINVWSSRFILRDVKGRAYRMIGTLHDISEQKVLEEKLEMEIRLKEKQITDAAEDAMNKARSDIGKELHDNVNQLLGASRLYLEMAKKGGTDSEIYLQRSSEYTLTAIEEIRKLSKGLTTDIIRTLGLCGAIEHISHDIMQINPVKIVFRVEDSIEKKVNDKFKLALYRIIQEQLNNILKHAKATTVIIQLLQHKKLIRLKITDNGIGFDTCKKRKGIGVANIKSRAASYNGTAEFISQPGSGCVLTATFSSSDELLARA